MSQTARDIRIWAIGLIALVAAFVAIWQLERPRAGLEITPMVVGTTPATLYRQPDASAPAVVIAHGFAGSRQLMESYALTLARAGYQVVSFDFKGHGRNPVPMSGDVDAIDGTTRLLVNEVLAVVEASAGLAPDPIAVLGHSMATDILVRAAAENQRIGPVVAVSMFSQEVTSEAPADLLMITGQWEGALRSFAVDALRMVDPAAGEGDTATAGEVRRRAIVAPYVEHVGVLYSSTGLTEAVAWLDSAYDRQSDRSIAATGPWLLLLLAAIVTLAAPLARLLPEKRITREPLEVRQFAILLIVPALVAPLIAVWIDIGALPVLVADYLMVHLLIYGVLQMALLWLFGVPWGRFSIIGAVALLIWGLGAFGLALDRYGASFVPSVERLVIIAVLAAGAVPFMAADALASRAGREGLGRRLLLRIVFFISLAIAISLDFERLFFLAIIAPVIVLFFLVFGLMGRWVGRRCGALTAGVALGLILAWALGVTFPLFIAAPAT